MVNIIISAFNIWKIDRSNEEFAVDCRVHIHIYAHIQTKKHAYIHIKVHALAHNTCTHTHIGWRTHKNLCEFFLKNQRKEKWSMLSTYLHWRKCSCYCCVFLPNVDHNFYLLDQVNFSQLIIFVISCLITLHRHSFRHSFFSLFIYLTRSLSRWFKMNVC